MTYTPVTALSPATQRYAVTLADTSQIGEARRLAAQTAQRAGFDSTGCATVSIVATELATNVIRHAKRGEMLVHALADESGSSLELIAIDRGPGMADPARCMTDGYSTGGTLGQGLGAIHRLSAVMDIYSAPQRGTVVYSRIHASGRNVQPQTRELPWCGISVAAPSETECGDSWRVARSEKWLSAVVADGLGHGPLAAKAADQAMRTFEQAPFAAPETYLAKAHEALYATRGAALACALVDLDRRTLLYAGVGNISATLMSRETQTEKSLPSHNGTVGLQVGRLQQFQYQALEGDLLLMHSDGLTARWKLADYPGLSRRLPALIAAVLYRDFKRGRDDATVVAVRLQ